MPEATGQAQPLSPAAQAVLDAMYEINLDFGEENAKLAAAALQAVADQVVPEPPMIVPGGRSYEGAWSATVQDAIRRQILAIAAELEGEQ